MKLGEDNMKLGETIDYMMENRYEGIIESQHIICKGEYFYPEEDFLLLSCCDVQADNIRESTYV